MDNDLQRFLEQERVKKETIETLIKEEFYTVEDLASASDELLKSCEISGGQVLRVKNACAAFLKKTSIQESSPSSEKSSTSSKKSSPSSEKTSPSSEKSLLSSGKSLPSSVKSSPSSEKSSPSSEKSSPSSEKSSPSSEKSSLLSSSKTPAFSPCQVAKSSWLVNFQLPSSFSPAVTKALDDNNLSGNRRNELTRDISSAIRVHTMYPTKAEREHVAFLLIRKYPFLKNAIGTGIGSWETAIKNRFKNQRKTGQKSVANSMVKGGDERDDVLSPQVSKKRRLEASYDIVEGETKDTCKDHIKAMKQELARSSNRNVALIKDLMGLTYPFRREWLLKEMVSVKEFTTEYPALKTVFGIKAEFGRILGKKQPVKDMAETFQQTWVERIISFAGTQSSCKHVIDSMQEAITDNPSKKNGIEEAAAVALLPCLLKEKGGNPTDFIKICTEEESIDEAIQETKSPRIIGSGDFWQLDSLCIAVEGVDVINLASSIHMATALSLLVASFYVFNMMYPPKCANAYLFCEAALLEIHENAKKRVAVNKFISALNLCG